MLNKSNQNDDWGCWSIWAIHFGHVRQSIKMPFVTINPPYYYIISHNKWKVLKTWWWRNYVFTCVPPSYVGTRKRDAGESDSDDARFGLVYNYNPNTLSAQQTANVIKNDWMDMDVHFQSGSRQPDHRTARPWTTRPPTLDNSTRSSCPG